MIYQDGHALLTEEIRNLASEYNMFCNKKRIK